MGLLKVENAVFLCELQVLRESRYVKFLVSGIGIFIVNRPCTSRKPVFPSKLEVLRESR